MSETPYPTDRSPDGASMGATPMDVYSLDPSRLPGAGALEDAALLAAVSAATGGVEVDPSVVVPSCDWRGRVRMPPAARFFSHPDLSVEQAWAQTLLHEAAHAASKRRLGNATNLLLLFLAFFGPAAGFAGAEAAAFALERFGFDGEWTLAAGALLCVPAANWLTARLCTAVKCFEECVAETVGLSLCHALGIIERSSNPRSCAFYFTHHLVLMRRKAFGLPLHRLLESEGKRRGLLLFERLHPLLSAADGR